MPSCQRRLFSEFPGHAEVAEAAVIAATNGGVELEAVHNLVAQADRLVRSGVLSAEGFDGELQLFQQREFVADTSDTQALALALRLDARAAQVHVQHLAACEAVGGEAG